MLHGSPIVITGRSNKSQNCRKNKYIISSVLCLVTQMYVILISWHLRSLHDTLHIDIDHIPAGSRKGSAGL